MYSRSLINGNWSATNLVSIVSAIEPFTGERGDICVSEETLRICLAAFTAHFSTRSQSLR
jgi:hypothetical protein